MDVWSWPPSRSTEVNQGKKQKCCSLSCLWSQVQRDTCGQVNSQTLGGLWTKHHRCTYMWDWTEMPTVSFRLRAKTVYILLHMSREISPLEEGHDWFPLELRLSAGNISRKNHEKVYQKIEHLDNVIFRVLAFGVRVFLHKLCFMKEFLIILTSLLLSLSWGIVV